MPKTNIPIETLITDLHGEDWQKRCDAGATGVNQVYRNADDPNTITVVIEWDNEENARKFVNDPGLREAFQKAGVVGMPAVRAILSRA